MSKDGKARSKVKSVDFSTLPSLPTGWCWATIDDLPLPSPIDNGWSVRLEPKVLALHGLRAARDPLTEHRGWRFR